MVRSTEKEDPATTRSPSTPSPTATLQPDLSFDPLSDGAALVALYDATEGDNWNTRDRWMSTTPIDQWHGVTIDAEGRVTALDLNGNGLSGELPAEIEYLTELTELNLSDNALSGALPAEIGSLTNLEEL